MRLAVGAGVVAWAIVSACTSSNDENKGQQADRAHTSDAALDSGATMDAPATVDASNASDASDAGTEEPCDAGRECPLGCRAGRCLVLTPSNLPPDICDTPGTKDFTGGDLRWDPDAIIHQIGGPDIYLYKFAHVSGDLSGFFPRITAIVATDSMQLGSAPSAPTNMGLGEAGEQAAWNCGAGGAGYGTPGGPQVTYNGTFIDPAHGSETAIPLLLGRSGGTARDIDNVLPALGGSGGSALQLVSCGTLTITGHLSVDGFAPERGSRLAAGGGGGSGGTLLIEAASVRAAPSSSLSSNGGAGGPGLARDGDRPGGVTVPGGAGGTATSPPGADTCGTGEELPGSYPGGRILACGAGAGGAVGRIRINVAAGTQPELLGRASPAPSIGTIATH
ncbi:hypothetical protein LZC95_11675 [Pendulispora brunnea]|uniref:Uncharacterized protein n=1 Tax=Pendulispora brunnea TaxID=2905690 RepID=A0ABZ2KIS6_9BACT